MRYLVYILVVTNLAYFAWHQLFPAQKLTELQPVPAPAGMNRLLLLSERVAAERGTVPRCREGFRPRRTVFRLSLWAGLDHQANEFGYGVGLLRPATGAMRNGGPERSPPAHAPSTL